MVEVDIEVPETWSDGFEKELSPFHYFEEMSPLFCTIDVPFEAFGSHMQQHVETFGLSKKPRRLLVGGMKARQMLLATPLLKWYLEHGMKVTKVYQVVEFQAHVVSQSLWKRSATPDDREMQITVRPSLQTLASWTETVRTVRSSWTKPNIGP